jgi:hypothetical protein
MNNHGHRHPHHEKESEREEQAGRIHPAWFAVLGTLLIALVVLTWTLMVP